MTKELTKYKLYDVSDPIQPKVVFTGEMVEIAERLDISENYARHALSYQIRIQHRYIIRKEE